MVKLIRFDDQNPSEQELEIFLLVNDVAFEFGVNPSVPIESEGYFIDLLAQYKGDTGDLKDWLTREIPKRFLAIGPRPNWLQSPHWPIAGLSPMVFAGQIDIRVSGNKVASGLYHDDTSLYIFVGPNVFPEVIIQQM